MKNIIVDQLKWGVPTIHFFLTAGLEKLIQFHQTESHGLPAQLDKYIAHDPPPPESRERGRTNAFHLAIQGGLEQNVINIINHKKRPSPNSRDSEGESRLSWSHTE